MGKHTKFLRKKEQNLPPLVLRPNDILFIDFDGTITERDIYPEITHPHEGIREFLLMCKKNKIKVFIWAARCNNTNEPEKYPSHGSKAIEQIKRYMMAYGLFYTDIAIINKPIGAHHAKYLLDDRSRATINGFIFKKR